MRAVVTIALLLSTRAALAQGDDISVYTVCEIMKNLAAYNGKTIIVVGRVSSTGEGVWLDQACPEKLVTNGYEWSTSIWLSYTIGVTDSPPSLPRTFRWNNKLLSTKLAEVSKTTSLRVYPEYHYSDRWAAVFGRLETRFPLDPTEYPGQFSGRSHPAGLGHLNGSPAQLISPRNGYHKLPQGKLRNPEAHLKR